MGWRGTALGGAVGLLVGGPLGALLGAALGEGAERTARRLNLIAEPKPIDRQRTQEGFFEGTFSIMGHIAKADGRVSQDEIAFTESVMDRMGLSSGLRRAAILMFNQGKSSQFDLDAALGALREAGLHRGPLGRIFLEVQVGAAYADGAPAGGQAQALERIRHSLQIPSSTLRRIERLVLVQQRILHGMYGGSGNGANAHGTGPRRREQETAETRASPLIGAYATLGLDPKAGDAEVKRAYRRLMSQHHPDKLMSRGLPEEAMKLASLRTQEIRRAYETITEARAA